MATPTQCITWTVLPNGITFVPGGIDVNGGGGGGFRLSFSVLVSPRLVGGSTSTLADFPDFGGVPGGGAARTWPDTLQGVNFFLVLADVPDANGDTPLILPAVQVPSTLGGNPPGPQGPFGPSPELWNALFPPNTPVNEFGYPDFSETKFHSAPAGLAADYIASLWSRFGTTSPSQFPAYGDLNGTDAFGAIGFEDYVGQDRGPAHRDALQGVLQDALEKDLAVPYDLSTLASDPADQAALAILEFTDFHQRGLTPLLPDIHGNPPEQIPKPPVPTFDFHQMVGLTMGLPAVQRLMGLALDFYAAGDQVVASGVTSSPARIVATFNGDPLEKRFIGATQSIFPRTQCVMNKGAFQAQTMFPDDSDYEGTQLVLGDPDKFRVVRVDTDSSAIKAYQFAGTVSRSRTGGQNYSGATPDGYALPALKTGGFAISKNGRATDMVSTIARQNAIESATFGSNGLPLTNAQGETFSPLLFLEDLVRGYRFDVYHADIDEWRSLMWREGDYTFLEAPSDGKVHVIEEGCVVETPTTASNRADDPGDLYLHENLAHWKGWSLAVPRIGTPASDDGLLPNQGGATFFQLDSSFAVPTTVPETGNPSQFLLPRLRFGESYRIRARAVDHAGNSVSPDDAAGDPTVTSVLEEFLRYEPVQAPRALLGNDTGPAEHSLTVVVRSESARDYGTLAIDNDSSLRFLVPPRTSVNMAEWHHGLDGFFSTPPPDPGAFATAFERLVTLDAGRLDTHPDAQPDPGQPGSFVYPSTGLVLNYLPDVLARRLILQGLPLQNGAPNDPTSAILNFQQPGLDWPDYHSCQVFLHRANLATNPANDEVSNWEQLTLSVDDQGYPAVPAQPVDRLNIALRQGDLFTVQLNCLLGIEALQLMALWEWILAWAGPNGHDPALVQEAVLNGNSWMFTPWREITFLHAVRAPLLVPVLRFDTDAVKTDVGQTFATFSGPFLPTGPTNPQVLMSRKSTSAIDVVGSWAMPIDTGSNDDPVTPVPFTGHAFTAPIDRLDGTPDFENLNAYRHEFNDTKYRSVSYQATATTSFMEYFREELAEKLTFTSANLANGIDPGIDFEPTTVQLTDSDTGQRLVQAPLGTEPGDTGVTADYTVFPYNPPFNPNPPTPPPAQRIVLMASSTWAKDIGTGKSHTADMTYVAPSIHTVSDPAADGTTAIIIPNSVRPDAPKVLYVVPIYNRTQTANGATRVGGALRVYLDRPWWSTGDKERLGVVCESSVRTDGAGAADPLDAYVTQWGYDPVYASRPSAASSLPTQPTPDCFPLKTGNHDGLTLEELDPSTQVRVAAHAVGFDPSQRPGDPGRWYCDIQLTDHNGNELQAYMPFVRLALARYQQNSIPACELSRVVLADFAQLSPTRSVTIGSAVFGLIKTVTVVGRAPKAGGTTASSASQSNLIQAFVEQQDSQLADPDHEDLSWSQVGSTVTLNATRTDTNEWTWAGEIVVPPNNNKVRITIQEYERIKADNAGHSNLTDSTRLVFSESIPTTAGLQVFPAPGIG